MLDLHRLRIFRSVVASGSIQAASANLGYTPSAISQHVAALQRETGLVLLERAGRGLQPTAAGFSLASEADHLLASISETEARITDLREGRTGSLSIAYFASAATAWLPTLLRQLHQEFPDLRIDLQLRDADVDAPDERADIHLVATGSVTGAGAGFVAHHLLEDPYVAVLPTNHPYAHRSTILLPDLADELWIDNGFAHGWCRRALLEACAAAGYAPNFHVEAHDYHAAMAFVAAGLGISVMPALGVSESPDHVVIRPVTNPSPVRNIYAIVRQTSEHRPPVQLALKMLRTAAREHHPHHQ